MVDFSQLKPFEIHTRYTLDKILPVQVVTSFDYNIRTLRAVMSHENLPRFNNARIDGYKLTAIVLFPDLKKRTAQTVVEESGILSVKRKQEPFDVSVTAPRRTKCFILCLRIDGYSAGKVYHTIASKGMKVIAAGTISR